MKTWAKVTLGIGVLAGAVYVMTRPRTKKVLASATKKLRGMLGLDQELPEVLIPEETEEIVSAEIEPTGPESMLPAPGVLQVGVPMQNQALIAAQQRALANQQAAQQRARAYAYQQQQTSAAMMPAGLLPQAASIYQSPNANVMQSAMMMPGMMLPGMTMTQAPSYAWASSDALIQSGIQSGLLIEAGVAAGTCGSNQSVLCKRRYRSTQTKKLLAYQAAVNMMLKYQQQGLVQPSTQYGTTQYGTQYAGATGATPYSATIAPYEEYSEYDPYGAAYDPGVYSSISLPKLTAGKAVKAACSAQYLSACKTKAKCQQMGGSWLRGRPGGPYSCYAPGGIAQ